MNLNIELLEDQLIETFKDKNIAYLALTGRSECTFRDLFVEHIQTTFEDKHILVSREFGIDYCKPINKLSSFLNKNDFTIKQRKLKSYSKTSVDLLICEHSLELGKRTFIEFGWNYSTEYILRSQQKIRNKIINDFGKNIPALNEENIKTRKIFPLKTLNFFKLCL